MTGVRLENVSKRFGSFVAVDDVSAAIEPGELFFLLGPSGCGKSTLLRMIAGLLNADGGRIFFNHRNVTTLPTEKRNAVMCFQSYALWPHMTVAENLRFGLKVRGLSRREQDREIAAALEIVRMGEYAMRKPNELSGGQQQRVALARALAVKPDCLLLDEPLSNLDAKLRNEMRVEIRRICKETGVTTIYVTHDQKEALSVADRIAVMNRGKLVQVGKPEEVYESPSNAFVAEFMGETNLISGRIVKVDGELAGVESEIGNLWVKTTHAASSVGLEVRVSVRPERIRISAGENSLRGRVVETTFLGEVSEHVVLVGAKRIRVVCSPARRIEGEVVIGFDAKDAVVVRS